MIRRLKALFFAVLLSVSACSFTDKEEEPRLSLFVGVDVSGSFTQSAAYSDSIRFLSYYLYAHLNGIGGLEKPRALFVGSIGGDTPREPKAFYPIHVFKGKSVQEIEQELLGMFDTRGNYLSDFNVFFKRISDVVQKQNLILSPITIVILSDGIPDLTGHTKARQASYKKIDVSPLEYLARNVTIRILYPSPPVAAAWEREVPRYRVRIWPVEAQVMEGWANQLSNHSKAEDEKQLWQWIRDIVDRRVRRQRIL